MKDDVLFAVLMMIIIRIRKDNRDDDEMVGQTGILC